MPTIVWNSQWRYSLWSVVHIGIRRYGEHSAIGYSKIFHLHAIKFSAFIYSRFTLIEGCALVTRNTHTHSERERERERERESYIPGAGWACTHEVMRRAATRRRSILMVMFAAQCAQPFIVFSQTSVTNPCVGWYWRKDNHKSIVVD